MVVLVDGLLRNISPPSSPKLFITLNLEFGNEAKNTSPLTPNPPPTTNAPVSVFVDAVEDDTDTTPPIVSTLSLALLDPSLTWNAVALELLRVITPVLVIVPVFVIAPLFKITPDIEEALEEDVNKLPPIPTPPVTVKAPVVVEPEAVDPVILTPEADNVLPKALTPDKTYLGVLPIEALLVEPVK